MSYTVRPAEPADFPAIQRIFSGPLAAAGTLNIPLEPGEARRRRMESPQPGSYPLVACAPDGEVVGNLGLHVSQRARRSHVAELGMAVRDDWQGRGVGSALMAAACDLADNWLQVSRIELTVYSDNGPAVALYKKFGFEVEGTLRRYAFRHGAYVDAYAMARLRPLEP
jgi:L-phenylalanine/L-methionine N-acetyltransferase